MVNTLFSCLAALDPTYSFAPRWRPPFVSALRPEDRCHLNGLALVDGQPRYVTALAETDTPHGWRAVKATGGCLIEVPSGRIVARGLALPHSPRVDGGQVFFLHSGHGQLATAHPASGEVEPGSEVAGSRARIWRSTADSPSWASRRPGQAWREYRSWPIATSCNVACGWWICGPGPIAAHLEFLTGVEEVFDVQVLPGITSPYVSGPWADRDTGQPLWTVPPA